MPSHGLPKIRALSAYDKTAINVRPDGSRIELDPKTSKAKARAEFQAKHRKQPVKTSRKGKTWIAADAYEFERIPKRRRVVQEESEESGVEKEKEKEVERKKKEPKRASAKRRRSNISDLSFLSNESVPRSAKHDTAGAGRIAHADLDPSSDLLKWIHFYTSRFYAASGEMINSEREHRVLKKVKSRKTPSPDSSEVEDLDSADEDEGDRQDAGPESDKSYRDDAQSDNNSDDKGAASKSGKERGNADPFTTTPAPKSKRKAYIERLNKKYVAKFCERRDMYRAFDGSALFCIGMILKAHIISKLRSGIPESWDDEVAAYQELEEELQTSKSEDKEATEEQLDHSAEEEDAGIGKDVKQEPHSEDDDVHKKPRRRKRKRRWKPNDDLKVNYVSLDSSHL